MLDREHHWNVSFKPLILGFILSLILTAAIFFTAKNGLSSGLTLIITVLALSSLQALIQLVFFLHLGLENKPHWNLVTFLFMLLILVVIVLGSLWIMYNLNYNMTL